MKSIHYSLFAFLLIKGMVVNAQSSCDSMSVCDCAFKDLSPAGIMFGHEHAKHNWKISYRYMSMLMADKLHGTSAVEDNYVYNTYIMSPQSMQMDMNMLMAMYGITNRLAVMMMFNYNFYSMQMTALPGATMIMDGHTMVMSSYSGMTTKSSGIGDTKLHLIYAIVNHNVHHVFLNAGFNLPTGSINKKGKADDMIYPGSNYPYMMQMGSGTIDFLPGITYLLKENKLSASAQVTTVLRPFYNSYNYHLGNELDANIWVAYKWLPWISTSIRVEENTTGMISGADNTLTQSMEPAAFSKNYGGQITAAFGGISFYFNKTWFKNTKFSVEYGIPVYQNVNGIQLAQKATLYAGWLVTF